MVCDIMRKKIINDWSSTCGNKTIIYIFSLISGIESWRILCSISHIFFFLFIQLLIFFCPLNPPFSAIWIKHSDRCVDNALAYDVRYLTELVSSEINNIDKIFISLGSKKFFVTLIPSLLLFFVRAKNLSKSNIDVEMMTYKIHYCIVKYL